MSSNEEYYAVEKIVAKKQQKSKTLYLVKWEGWSDEHNSWVPAKDCTKALIEEFKKTLTEATPKRSKSITKKRQSNSATKRKSSLSTTREETDTDRTAASSSVNLSHNESQANEEHPPDEETDADRIGANSSANLSRIESEDEIVPKQDTDKSKSNEKHQPGGPSRMDYESQQIARKRVPFRTELSTTDASRDALDTDNASNSASDSDSEDNLVSLQYPAEDLEIIGAAPARNGRLELWVKLCRSGRKVWFDSRKFGAAWPQVYIDYLERHKKLMPAPDNFSVKNLKNVTIG